MFALVIDYRPECSMVEDSGEVFDTIEQAQAFIRAECDDAAPWRIIDEDEYWTLYGCGMVRQFGDSSEWGGDSDWDANHPDNS
jgi:hypothetical protein